MRKLLIILTFFFINIVPVLADTTFWTNHSLSDNNLELVKEERRYKWYLEGDIIYSNDYYIEGHNPIEYPYIDHTDFIETDFNDWREVLPSLEKGRRIQVQTFKKYRILRPIRYLFFTNFQGGHSEFKISELNILINDQEINYTYTCRGCSSNFKSEINDGELIEPNNYITNGGDLTIDLGAYYTIDKLKLELYMYDTSSNTKKFDLYLNEGSSISDRNYAHKEFISYIVSQDDKQPEKYLIFPDATWITNPVFEDWVYVNYSLNNTYYREFASGIQYRYKDTKYRYYGYNRLYMDDYYVSMENPDYIKDDSQYKDYYLYKVIEDYNQSNNDTNDEQDDNNSNDTNNEQDDNNSNDTNNSDINNITDNNTDTSAPNQNNNNDKAQYNIQTIDVNKTTNKDIRENQNIENFDNKPEMHDNKENEVIKKPIIKYVKKYKYNYRWYMLMGVIIIEFLIILFLSGRKNRKYVA